MLASLERIRAALGHRRAPLVAALFAVLLTATSLGAGLSTEDYVQKDRMVHAANPTRQCFDLFAYTVGEAVDTFHAKSLGVLPWYAPDRLTLSFWRPLSSLTHCVDYSLFPSRAWLMHAESLAWFALAIVAVGALYRRIMGIEWVAGLAAFLYAVDHAHGPAVGWLANRNALLTTLFTALMLVAQDRATRGRSRVATVAAPLLFGLGLLSGEAAACGLGYLAAYLLVLDGRSSRARALTLAPYLALFVAWRIAYARLGHGNLGSALYVDPLSAWDRFVAVAAQRVPVLLSSQMGGPSADRLTLLPIARAAGFIGSAAALVLLLAVAFVPLLRASKTARFWALGMLLATIPIAAAPPSDRLLFPVGIGAMALVAEQIGLVAVRATRDALAPAWRWSAVALAAALGISHGIVSPIRLPRRSVEVLRIGERIAEASATLFAGTREADEINVLRGPEMFGCTFAIGLGYRLGIGSRRLGRCLDAGPSPLEVRRVDAHTISLRAKGGFLDPPLNRMQWDDRAPMEKGDVRRLTWLEITIDEVDEEGEPVAVSFKFDRALDDPAVHWVEWKGGRYAPVALPKPGEVLALDEQEPE